LGRIVGGQPNGPESLVGDVFLLFRSIFLGSVDSAATALNVVGRPEGSRVS
jgi:hypothetical protein